MYEAVACLVPKALWAVFFNSEPTGIGACSDQWNIALRINPHIKMLVKHTPSDFDMINTNVNVHEKKNNISKETHRSSFKTFRKPAVNSQISVFLVGFCLDHAWLANIYMNCSKVMATDCIDLLKVWLRTAVVTVHCSFTEPVSLGKWAYVALSGPSMITVNERLWTDAIAVVGLVILDVPWGVSRSLYCVSTSHLRRECAAERHIVLIHLFNLASVCKDDYYYYMT